MIVKVSTAQVSVELLSQHLNVILVESTAKQGQFALSKIDKKHISGTVDVSFSENPIIEGHRCGLINKPSDVEVCDFGTQQNRYSFFLG